MDLSGIIFAGLAVAWAVYLIPKALRHHDEMARSRSVDRFSHTMRVLGRNGSSAAAATRPEVRQVVKPPAPKAVKPANGGRPMQHTVTRDSARRAAARRRRVLGLLLLATVVVAGLARRLVVPWWTVAVPAALVVVFLVIARITVRRERSAAAPVLEDASDKTADDTEDTVEVSREQLAAAVASPVDAALADDGSLWDPLPMTLPTYVNKARARRTVRTIELTETAGVTSSGHDDADSALVAASAATEAAVGDGAVEERKVAGA